MHGMKKRVLCISAVVALLFGGCSPNNQPTPSGTVSGNPFEEHQESQEGILRMTHGAVDPDPEKGVLTYDGDPVHLTYMLQNEGSKTEWGFVIYVNGVMQPYTVEGEDGESTCHSFTIDKETRKDLKISFVPVVGKEGEELSVIYATVLMPSYVMPESEAENGYGYYHSYNMSLPMKLVMEKDAPNPEPDCVKATDYKVEDLPEWANGSNTTDLILEGGETSIYAKEGMDTEVDISIAGRENQTYRVSFYVNHKMLPVFDGHPYLDVDIQKDKLTTVTATVPAEEMDSAQFMYAVIAPVMDKFDLDAPQIKKTASKAVSFSEPPSDSPSTAAPDNSGGTTVTNPKDTSESSSSPAPKPPAANIDNSAFEKYPGLLKSPAPQTDLYGFLLLDNNRAFTYFANGSNGQEMWGGIYDFAQEKYVAYTDDLKITGEIQALKDGLCIYEYAGRGPRDLSAAYIYNNQLKLVKKVDFTPITEKDRIMSARISYEGTQFVYAICQNDTSTIYSVGLDMKDPQAVFTYNNPKKTNDLARIYTIQNVVGDTIVFGGNAQTSGDATLMGIGCVSTKGKNPQYQPVGYVWFDTKSPHATAAFGAQDMYDTVYSGKAYVLDHATQKIVEVRFKNKKESALVAVSQNGKYVGTVQSDNKTVFRLYDVATSQCVKECTISSDTEMGLTSSMLSIDDTARKIYLHANNTLYMTTF